MTALDRRRVLAGTRHALGLGFVAGGLEAAGLAARLDLQLGFVGFALTGLAAVVTLGTLAALLGLSLGLPVHAVRREAPASSAIASHLGLVGVALGAWYLWPAAAVLVDQGRLVGAAVFAVLPFPLYVVVAYNARYWLRRAARGEAAPPWLPVAFGVGGVLALVGAAAHAARSTGGHGALDGDPNVVIVTVAGLAEAPAGDVQFTQVVSPSPTPRVAHAALWTGLHPLRTEVVTAADVLSPGHLTVAEAFAQEGYATGAFVSNPELRADSGLAQGFYVYDDLPGGAIAGIRHVTVLNRLLPPPPARDTDGTVQAFLRWHRAHAGVPHLAWVQLDGPDAQAITAIRDAVAPLGDATMLAIVGTGQPGPGLGPERIVGPLSLTLPGREVRVPVVDAQVRLYDLAPTALEFARLDALPVTEGIELVGYATGTRSRSLPVVLIGTAGDDPFDSALIGLRTEGVQYEREVRTGVERLYDLANPHEDIASEHPATVAKARGMLAPDESSYRRLLLGEDP